jgi:biotin-(acetyl-CoA carboxylase) ligase
LAVASVLDGIAETYAEWGASGFACLRDEFDRRSSLVGEAVMVSDRDGTVRASGMVCGVDELGRLLVAGTDGVDAISAGEVTLRAPRQS